MLLLLAVWLGTLLPGWLGPQTGGPAVSENVAKSLNINGAGTGELQDPGTAASRPSGDGQARVSVAAGENGGQARIRPSLLDQRLSETEKWLNGANDDHYSIQLFMTRIADAKALERFLGEPSDLLDLEKIYVYETKIGGSRMYSVLYSDFDSRKTARSMLQDLPADMKASKPFLRRVSALRKEFESSS